MSSITKRRTVLTGAVGAICLAGAAGNAGAQVFTVTNLYSTDNPPARQQFEAAALAGGALGFQTETFNTFNGAAGDPNIDIPPGTTLVLPSGMSIFYDESPDAGSASSAEIDRNNNTWNGTPPFEPTAAFEGFANSPAPGGVGTNLIRFTFPTPVIGFSADYDSPASGGDLIIVIDGQRVAGFNENIGSADGYLGYVHNVPFTTFEYRAENPGFAGEVFDVDNITFAPVIPEPASVIGGAAAVAGLLLPARRRRR